MFKFGRENKAATMADVINFGGKSVEIPKLTIAKWKLLFDRIETLPSVLLNVFSARNTSDFSATLVAGLSLVLDEVVELVAVLTDLDKEWIEQNVDQNELIDFIAKTVEKNDLSAAVKKFRGVFGNLMARAVRNTSPSANGSSSVGSSSE